MPPVRTYQGKKPAKKASIRPVQKEPDAFDQLFRPRPSPHPFSSSSEALPTPSPGLSHATPSEKPTSESVVPHRLKFFSDPLFCERTGWRHDFKPTFKSGKVRRNRKIRKNPPKDTIFKLSLTPKACKETAKHMGVPLAESTPISRAYRKCDRVAEADKSRNKYVATNLEVAERAFPRRLPNVPAIPRPPRSLSNRKLSLSVTEGTPKSSGTPLRTSMDSEEKRSNSRGAFHDSVSELSFEDVDREWQKIRTMEPTKSSIPLRTSVVSVANKLLGMNLGGASEPPDKNANLSRISESDVNALEEPESLCNVKASHLLAGQSAASGAFPSSALASSHETTTVPEQSPAFLGFSSLPTQRSSLPVSPDKEPDVSRLMKADAETEKDEKSILPENSRPNMGSSSPQVYSSPAFHGFSSTASMPVFAPPTSEEMTLYQPSPCYVTRRRPRTMIPSRVRFTRGVLSELITTPCPVRTLNTSCSSHDSPKYTEDLGSRLGRLIHTSVAPSPDDSALSDYIVRRRTLQRASDHIINENIVSPDGRDSLVGLSITPKQLLRKDSGSGESLENVTKKKHLLPSRNVALQGSVEVSPEENRSDSRRSSRDSVSGMSFEDVTKKWQSPRTMDPTKRDIGDIASPESSHSGVDSYNESAVEEVGIALSKRLSGLKEGSSSGTSSDDFCAVDSVPSSPERPNRNSSTRAMDLSNFRRKNFESVPSSRNSLRDDLMSSSEDENDEEGFSDILSRPSDVALFQPYEPGSLEPLHENVEILDDEDENSSLSSESSAKRSPVDSLDSNRTPNMRRKANRHSEERSPTGRSSLGRASVIPELVSVIEEDSFSGDGVAPSDEQPLRLPGGKKYRRSLLIIQNIDDPLQSEGQKGRRYHENVEKVLRFQVSQCESQAETPVQMIRDRISIRRKSWIKQNTPPPRRRLTLTSKTLDRFPVTPETLAAHQLPLLRISSRPDRPNRTSLLPDRTLPRPCTSQDVESYSRESILRLCDQAQLASFSDILPPDSYDGCSKLGEGVYGEVFSVRRNDISTVLKIIPVEGSRKVNDADQKTYGEIAPELIIAKKLHDLKFEALNAAYMAGGFAEVLEIKLVQGCYPTQLLDCWDEFDKAKGSDNDRPDFFTGTQQFIVLEQGNAGTALEDYNFNHASTALSLFKQITYSLAVAERALEFEHRDLHWGNVLIARTKTLKFIYRIDSKEFSVPTNGVKGTIIDYTLSRMNTANGPVYNDLSKDPELFLGTGDFQFDVYRQMKKDVKDDWSQHQPKTNARWLLYLLDKLLKKEYQRKTAKVHKDGLRVLKNIETWIETCNSAVEVSERLTELR